jgi:hypothetical protein
MTDNKREYLNRGPATYLPKGVLGWASVLVPDTKFKAEGEYHAKVVLPGTDPAAQKLMQDLDAAAAAAKEGNLEELKAKLADAKTGADKAKAKKAIEEVTAMDPQVSYSFVPDDDGNPTTDVEFRAKMPAERKDRKTGRVIKQKPDVVDAKGKPCMPDAVWRGTVARLVVRVKPYATPKAVGAGLFLQGVQIIKLAEANAGVQYEAEEDGYSADDEEPTRGYAAEPEGGDDDEPGGTNF